MYLFNHNGKSYVFDYKEGIITYGYNDVVGHECADGEHRFIWTPEHMKLMEYDEFLNITNIDFEKITPHRVNCDNKPSELIEALCHIIPDMSTKDDVPNHHTKLKISPENLQAYINNIKNDKNNYEGLIKNKYDNIPKLELNNQEIQYIYIPGKIRDTNIPDEINNLLKKCGLKENKSDYYIKYDNGEIHGFSVKDTEQATKINYSVEKCIRELDPDLSKYLSKLRKYICMSNGIHSNDKIGGARDQECRGELNKIFNREDLYHTTINIFIKWNNEYVKNYIINNMFSLNIDYPIYECIKGKISNINKTNITYSKLEAYPDAELKRNGEVRNIAKLFYKLTLIFNDGTKKDYRIETRIKGSWWSGSIQFQSHLINLLSSPL